MTATKDRALRIAADISGTFTDAAAFDEAGNWLLLGKALSTPQHLVDGISASIALDAHEQIA